MARTVLAFDVGGTHSRALAASVDGGRLDDFTQFAYSANQVAQFAFLSGDVAISEQFQEKVLSEVIKKARWAFIDGDTLQELDDLHNTEQQEADGLEKTGE